MKPVKNTNHQSKYFKLINWFGDDTIKYRLAFKMHHVRQWDSL